MPFEIVRNDIVNMQVDAIAGSIAESFYGVPEAWKAQCRQRLPDQLVKVLDRFDAALAARR